MPKPVRLRYVALVGLFIFPVFLSSQTVLRPGDLAVVGVNANLSGCGEEQIDLISFVCFRDIEPFTSLDMTDNGWERVNPGRWGNTEGFLTVQRTGATIPAGTVITFRLPPAGLNMGGDYSAVAPDGDWTFTSLGTNTLNFNSLGDQIYFLQGGEWDNGTSGQHDATYSGGLVLFGFNTKTVWNAGVNSPQESGLHPDVIPCYHMEPSSGATDFISYSGPVAETNQLEWVSRLSNSDNWSTYPDCPSYLDPPASIRLRTGDLDLVCTVCTGCDTIQETLRFQLPALGGPFTVTYTDGTNDYIASGLNDGDVDQVEVTKTVTFSILSVEDANGCPVYSNFGPGDIVRVTSPPPVSDGALLESCDDGTGQALFDLTSVEGAVNPAGAAPVRWFEDEALSRPIADPTAYRSGAAPVFVLVGADGCTAPPVQVTLALTAGPAVAVNVEQNITCHNFNDGAVRLSISGGAPPYRIDWSDDRFDNQLNPVNMPAGTFFVTVTDTRGCLDSAVVSLSEPPPLELSCGQERPASVVGGNDGQAAVSINGGVPPYRVAWSGPVGNNQTLDTPGILTLDNLSAGNYSVLVTDGNGCDLTCAFTINDPLCTLNLTLAKQDVSCAGLGDGAIDVTLSGGTAPFDFNWGGPPLDGQEDPQNLPAGTYSVVVTDAVGCVAVGNAVIENTFPALSATIVPGGPVCAGDCSGFLLMLAGTPPFQLRYELRAGTSVTERSFSTANLQDQLEICPADFNAADTIAVRFLELEDANCIRPLNQTEFIFLLPEAVSHLDTLLCAGDSLVINGVTYNAANPSGVEVLSGGSSNGCDSVVNINLRFTEAAELRLDTLLCEGESLLVNGVLYDEGNPRGTELLKGASTTGCDSLIIVNLRYLADTTVRIEPVLCSGQSLLINGTRYDESNPAGTEIFQRSTGCDSTVVIDLRFVTEITRTIDSTLCRGEQLFVNGVIYDETNPRGREVIAGGSSTGCDSVVVVDLTFGGGSVRLDTILCEGESLLVNGTRYDVNNPSGTEVLTGVTGCDSTITVNLRFEGAVTTVLDTTLCAGESLLVNGTVYDAANPSGEEMMQRASGCDSLVQINLTFAPSVEASLTGGGEICRGDTARLVFRLSGAEVADIQYSDGINPPVLLSGIADGYVIAVSPAVSTTYRLDLVLVGDATCPPAVAGAAQVVISSPQLSLEAADFEGYGVSCFGASDGAVSALASGGVPPLAYRWSTGVIAESLDNLPAGSYSVTVTDAVGCVATDSLTLYQPDEILVQLQLVEPSCPGDRDGAIILDAIDGGAPPYNYSLDGSTFSTATAIPTFVRDIGAGAYQLVIRDANGCESRDSLTVSAGILLTLELGADTTIRRGDSLLLSPRANFSVDSLYWSPATSLSNPGSLVTLARPVVTTTYMLTAFDPKGCRITDRITVSVDERSRIFAPNAFSPNDDGVNDRFLIFGRTDDLQSYDLHIFDRWGGLVFDREDIVPNAGFDGWDGRVRGRQAHSGVYVFFAEIRYRDGTAENLAGEITLVR